ncbi:MAG: hypothetical protein WBD20_07180 [Pirellulaceae bacterium]
MSANHDDNTNIAIQDCHCLVPVFEAGMRVMKQRFSPRSASVTASAGKRYETLSAITNEVTGSHVNGFAFFKLNPKKGAAK